MDPIVLFVYDRPVLSEDDEKQLSNDDVIFSYPSSYPVIPLMRICEALVQLSDRFQWDSVETVVLHNRTICVKVLEHVRLVLVCSVPCWTSESTRRELDSIYEVFRFFHGSKPVKKGTFARRCCSFLVPRLDYLTACTRNRIANPFPMVRYLTIPPGDSRILVAASRVIEAVHSDPYHLGAVIFVNDQVVCTSMHRFLTQNIVHRHYVKMRDLVGTCPGARCNAHVTYRDIVELWLPSIRRLCPKTPCPTIALDARARARASTVSSGQVGSTPCSPVPPATASYPPSPSGRRRLVRKLPVDARGERHGREGTSVNSRNATDSGIGGGVGDCSSKGSGGGGVSSAPVDWIATESNVGLPYEGRRAPRLIVDGDRWVHEPLAHPDILHALGDSATSTPTFHRISSLTQGSSEGGEVSPVFGLESSLARALFLTKRQLRRQTSASSDTSNEEGVQTAASSFDEQYLQPDTWQSEGSTVSPGFATTDIRGSGRSKVHEKGACGSLPDGVKLHTTLAGPRAHVHSISDSTPVFTEGTPCGITRLAEKSDTPCAVCLMMTNDCVCDRGERDAIIGDRGRVSTICPRDEETTTLPAKSPHVAEETSSGHANSSKSESAFFSPDSCFSGASGRQGELPDATRAHAPGEANQQKPNEKSTRQCVCAREAPQHNSTSTEGDTVPEAARPHNCLEADRSGDDSCCVRHVCGRDASWDGTVVAGGSAGCDQGSMGVGAGLEETGSKVDRTAGATSKVDRTDGATRHSCSLGESTNGNWRGSGYSIHGGLQGAHAAGSVTNADGCLDACALKDQSRHGCDAHRRSAARGDSNNRNIDGHGDNGIGNDEYGDGHENLNGINNDSDIDNDNDNDSDTASDGSGVVGKNGVVRGSEGSVMGTGEGDDSSSDEDNGSSQWCSLGLYYHSIADVTLAVLLANVQDLSNEDHILRLRHATRDRLLTVQVALASLPDQALYTTPEGGVDLLSVACGAATPHDHVFAGRPGYPTVGGTNPLNTSAAEGRASGQGTGGCRTCAEKTSRLAYHDATGEAHIRAAGKQSSQDPPPSSQRGWFSGKISKSYDASSTLPTRPPPAPLHRMLEDVSLVQDLASTLFGVSVSGGTNPHPEEGVVRVMVGDGTCAVTAAEVGQGTCLLMRSSSNTLRKVNEDCRTRSTM
eukprot:Rmarinus@m.22723